MSIKEVSFGIQITQVTESSVHNLVFVSIHRQCSHQNSQSTKCPVIVIPKINSRVAASGDWLKTSSFSNICVVWNILDRWHSSGLALIMTLERGVPATVCQLCVIQQIINISWVTRDLK